MTSARGGERVLDPLDARSEPGVGHR
jgi:hypothetical protein